MNKIKHIYCNTKITRKENKKQANVQINETQNTVLKNKYIWIYQKYLTMDNRIFWAECVVNVVWTD